MWYTTTVDKCSIEGCNGTRRKRGWCEKHYSRFRVHGDPMKGARTVLPDKCEVSGCEKKPVAKDKCHKHYYAERRVPATPRPPKPKAVCAIDGCDEYAKVRGWCGAHYQRWRRFGDPLHYSETVDMTCSVEGCERVKNARGLCGPHYYRLQTYGDPQARPISRKSAARSFPPRECQKCGKVFDPKGSSVRKYCGRKCARAKRGGSVNRRSWVERLGERDGWTCHLCGEPVDRKLYWPHGLAGSVDHVIPVKAGGDDSPENLALAHLTCNVSRGATPL